MDVLVTYDIADTEGAGASRLKRIAAVCEKYGQRVQLSVFECRLSSVRLARMIGEVEDVIDRHRDSVLVYRFPAESKTPRSASADARATNSVNLGCSDFILRTSR